MNRILDDLDPYAGQAPSVHASFIQSTDSDSVDWLASLGAGYPRRRGHGGGSFDAAERSALIDFTASPPAPPPAAHGDPSSTSRPRRTAPLSLLDDSFAYDSSPIRITVAEDSDASTETAYLPPIEEPSRIEVKENVGNGAATRARPVRKRWSVMSRLKDEQETQSRSSLSPPAKQLTPLKQADQSTFFSPTQLEAVDVSLIADEGGSFLATMADSSDTVDSSRFVPVPPPVASTSASASREEDLSATSRSREDSGGMSVLLQRLDIAGDASDRKDLGLAKSSILPASLTSSHRRALQQSVAPSSSLAGPLDATFALDEPTRGDVSLLNCSTASFKDYRDSPRKPRLALATHTEDWSLEIERDDRDDTESEGDGGKTPRPTRKAPRVSDATSEGSSGASFRLDGLQTSTLGTAILNQSPPTAALKPESTGTLRLEYGLDSLPSCGSTACSRSPPLSPVSDLASSTCTVVAPNLAGSGTTNTVREGDLLGVEALAPRPVLRTSERSDSSSGSVSAQGKTLSGAERLKKRLEELRAQKNAGAAPQESASLRRSGSLRASGSARIGPAVAMTTTPARRMLMRRSLAPATVSSLAPSTTGRLPRSRSSILPASAGSMNAPAPTTPGERKESTAMRLERLRSERKERDLARTATPGRAGGGLIRSASFVAPRQSLASSTGPTARRLPSSRSLADLAPLGVETAGPAARPAVRRGSLLPAPAPSRRTSLVPAAPRPRMSLAPPGSSGPAAQQSLTRSGGSSARMSVAPSTSIRRSSSLQQVVPISAASGRRSSIAAASGRPAFATIAPPQARTSLKPAAAARAPRSSLAAVPQRRL
ncbi:hypothetical protein BMF94_0846 [Rhodotorula taiwanensis]|uniref:Uncharacterized protein n=1 Tax=Rhodotorula taiwanensis TaxID=741276 RepID=A0A2S5BH98_9BASI|nr:hypothetical protein BMF94_0846 [Rhodotorula taiwanensis]